MSPVTRRRRSRAPLALLLVGGVVALLLIAVGVNAVRGDGASTATSDVAQVRPVTVDGTPLPPFAGDASNDPAVGMTAPSLTGQSFDGSKEAVGGATGKPTLVLFVAHWCPHCQREVPRVVEWRADGTIPDDIDLVAVSTSVLADQDNYPPSTWLDEVKWPGRIMADSARDDASAAYGLPSYPYFVALDGNGKVLARDTGELDQQAVQNLVSLLQGA